jgi:thioredoxin-like negative regulator of GroEL
MTRAGAGGALLLVALLGCRGGQAADAVPVPESSWIGAPTEYREPGVLVVVTWADWASTWPLLREEVERYRETAPAEVDFMYANADDHPDLVRAFGEPIVPSVHIIRNGMTLEILPNVTAADVLRVRVDRRLYPTPAGAPATPSGPTPDADPDTPASSDAGSA